MRRSFSDPRDDIIRSILSGPSALSIVSFDRGVVIDVRSYPARCNAELDLEKVTRGSRDGFAEPLLSAAEIPAFSGFLPLYPVKK